MATTRQAGPGIRRTSDIGNGGWIVLLIGIVGLVFAAISCIRTSEQGAGTNDSTTVLAIITGTVIAIERVLEFAWTLVGQFVDSSWPKALSDAARPLVNRLRDVLTQYVGRAKSVLETLKGGAKTDAAAAAGISQQLAAIEAEVAGLGRDGNAERLQEVARLVSATAASLKDIESTADLVEGDVIAAVDAASAFLDTFKDNPGRRLISIVIGSTLGLVVAGRLHLDVFHATGIGDGLAWGVAFTGVTIGLGSNPTHEVIQALQKIKNARTPS